MRIHTRALTTGSFIAFAIAALASPAAAQNAEQPVEAQEEADQPAPGPQADAPEEQSVVVTGSRIPRANFDTIEPAVVLGSQQIEERGYTNLGDALDELPAFGVPGNNPVGGQAGAFGAGQTFVNFFGLGDQRTLTVINGRRFVSSNTASIFGPTGAGSQVDFNVIPTLLVDRVETIAVGGAPIYGSDAIAGTVNVITKQNFHGIQLDGQYGISELGDAPEYRIGALAGYNFGGGRGNLTVAVEYNRARGLTATDRPGEGLNRFFVTCADPNAPTAQCLIEDRRLPVLSEFGIPLVYDFVPLSPQQAADFGGFQPSVLDANGNPLAFDRNGNLVPIDFGEATGDLITSNGGNGFFLPANLLTDTRRILAVAQAHYDFSDNVRVFGEAWYANSRGQQLRDQPVYNTYLFGTPGSTDGQFIINIDNPFLTPQARAIIQENLLTSPFAASPDSFFLTRANTDIIPSDGESTVELYRFVGGVDFNFNAFGNEQKLQVVGNYGRSTTQGRERVLIQQNFENALNNPASTTQCAPGVVNAPIAAISSTCFPINPFGQQIDQRAIDYITTFAEPRAMNDQWLVTASLAGNLFDLWGGPVGYAIGLEHREESAEFDPGAYYFGQPDPNDPTTRTQFGRSIPIDPVSGEFHTNEAFAELTLPIIGRDQNIPLVHTFEAHGAVRYIDHSLAGGDWTYTVGARWQPIRDLTIRGNFTRSVRSPAVTELFNPTSQIFTTASDPCDQRFREAGPNPSTRQANCAADGLPADFQSNIVDFTAKGTLQGNPNLANETANAWTVGAILRPRFLPGLTLTADWVDIELQGAVESLDATTTLNACYDDPNFPTGICDQFTRDANGQITFIQTGYANAASRQFQGLIAELAWRFDTPFLGAGSRVDLGVNYLYIDQLETRVGQGDLATLRGSIGYSKHQFTANARYANDDFSWLVQAQFIGPALFDPDEPANNRDIPGVGSVVFFNTTVSIPVADRFDLRLIVDNVFDTDPPFPSPGGGGQVTYFDGVLGRYFKVGARVRF